MCSGQGKGRGDDAATGCLEVDDSSVRLALLRRADHRQLQTSLSSASQFNISLKFRHGPQFWSCLIDVGKARSRCL